jgi:hypothetical protein
MEKLTMPHDAAIGVRKAFIEKAGGKVVPAKIESIERERIRAQIADDNKRNLKTNWFCAKLKSGFKGILG